MDKVKEVLFVAAENGALKGGKVGGVADVVRDLPAALHEHGWRATVITPAYANLHKSEGARQVERIKFAFGGHQQFATLWRVQGNDENVRNLVVEHALFASGAPGEIYSSDEPGRPYAKDANKFAFFCTAVARWVDDSETRPDAVHLHDWHAAFYLLLREYSRRHINLKDIPTAFTIHNIAYQGTRPLHGDESSLEHWLPGLPFDPGAVSDPRYADCINPMAMAVRLADRVGTVSPTYAEEICRPSDAANGFIGGEGLEGLLQQARDDGRLAGVLNGCFYDERPPPPSWPIFLHRVRRQVGDWQQTAPNDPVHALAHNRLETIGNDKPANVLASIGRLVSQKVTLLSAPTGTGVAALERLAVDVDGNALIVILGSGESAYEEQLLDIARRNDNILFLKGYSESVADPLYELADLFLMPSSFEPCGISQMLAMRAGLPCVVHGVGGLKDTVKHRVNGFVFTGADLVLQADGFVATTLDALSLKSNSPAEWNAICEHASAARFEWSGSALATIEALYEQRQ